MERIRAAGPGDLAAVTAITLATGDAGRDAAALYRDPDLLGQIYSRPYLHLASGFGFVVEDGDGVAGFVLGTSDTRAFEADLERQWWPALRRRYPDPDADFREGWTADQRLAALIHHPETAPDQLVRQAPAHLHLNLLPRARGRGMGRGLLEAWIAAARNSGVTAAFVGVARDNVRGLGFWQACGFRRQPVPEYGGGAVWLLRRIAG